MASTSLQNQTSSQARPVFAAIAAISVTIIIFGSWEPFFFHPADAVDVWQSFLSRGSRNEISGLDVFVNFWLGFPLVLGLSGLIRSHVGSATDRCVKVAVILLVQISISLIAELGQGWLMFRYPSVVDFAIQFTGAVVATIGWQSFGGWIDSGLNFIFDCQLHRGSIQFEVVLYLATIGILVWNVLPLNTIVSPLELTTGVFTRFESSPWEKVLPWVTKALLAMPLGLWLSRRLATQFGGRFSLIDIILLGIGTGLLLEVVQIPIGSHVIAGTGVFVATLGSVVGIVIGIQFRSNRVRALKKGKRDMVCTAAFWFAISTVLAISICAMAWTPFDFSTDSQEIADRVLRLKSNNFSSYRSSDLLTGLTLLNQLLMAAALGTSSGLAYSNLRRRLPGCSALTGILLVFLLTAFLFGVEFGQLIVDSRSAEALGLLVRLSGSGLGLVIALSWSGNSPDKGMLDISVPNVEPRASLNSLRFCRAQKSVMKI